MISVGHLFHKTFETMKSIKTILLITYISIISFNVFASDKKWTISGTITEFETNESIPYATVALYSKNKSNLITGVISNDNGQFLLEKISEGDYFIKISFMGYKDHFIDSLNFDRRITNIDLGTIQLKTNVEALNEVLVTSKAKAIKNTIDRQILSVSSNLSATGGTAVDALKLSPSIQIDSDDNVKLRGSANFIVLINGKPTTLSAQDVLKTITPAELKTEKDRVEFYYRQARLLHKINQENSAIEFYKKTISESNTLQTYFAPNSCLQLGYLYQEKNDPGKAEFYFKKAISYKRHEYKNSIDSKARSALAQLKSER